MQDIDENIKLLQELAATDDYLEVPPHVVNGKSMPGPK
jgi:hypothetical protein